MRRGIFRAVSAACSRRRAPHAVFSPTSLPALLHLGVRRDAPSSAGQCPLASEFGTWSAASDERARCRGDGGSGAGRSPRLSRAVCATAAVAVAASFPSATESDLTVGELKSILVDAGVDFRDCVEKAELVERVIASRASFPASIREKLAAMLRLVMVAHAEGKVAAATTSDAADAAGTRHGDGGLLPDEANTVAMFKRCAPSVVHITTSVNVRGGLFSLDVAELPQGTGSGFVWDAGATAMRSVRVVRTRERRVVLSLFLHSPRSRPFLCALISFPQLVTW